jgi:hypothetical protein
MLPLEVDDSALYGAVANALWRQRDLLEGLLHRLVGERLVLTNGATRWLARADDDVRAALEELRCGEVTRAMEVEALARHLGRNDEMTLADLAAAAPGIWAVLLSEHLSALRQLAFEVQQAADENHRLLAAGARAVRETLAGIGSVVSIYDANGAAVRDRPGALLLDEQV